MMIEAAAGITGRGLAVSGPPGVGKSWLLREAVAALGTDQYAIWTASANAATSGLPFGSFAHLLPMDQPAGLSPTGVLRWAADALAHQAAGRRIVFAVDDIHLVDLLSATLINLVARSEHATVLATLRSGEPVHECVAALWTDDIVDRIELAPLSLADTAQLLAHVLGGPADAASTRRLHQLSEGNALLLRELVLAARSAGDFAEAYGIWRWTGRLDLAPSLVEIIDARIGQLSEHTRTVLELVAFGEPLGLAMLRDATDAGSVEMAEERQLIRIDRDDRRTCVRLAHPLYGEVVRGRCPVTRRHRLLAQLAQLLEQTGARRRDDLLQIAVWRLESQTARDPDQLIAAARQAFASFNMPLALRLASAARDTGGGFDAAVLLATILMFADRAEDALAALGAVRSDVDRCGRTARWQATYGFVRYWGLGLEVAADELSQAANDTADPGHRAWMMSFESLMRLHHLEWDESLRLARAVLDRPAASAGARALARTAIAHLQAVRGRTSLATRIVAAVEAEAPAWRAHAPYIQLAVELARCTGLVLAGQLTRVEQSAATELAGGSDLGEFRLGTGYLCILLGQAARLRGQLNESQRHLRKACATLATNRPLAALANAERAHCAALRGDAEEATQAMAEADQRHQPTMAIFYPWLEQARCWVLVSTGDLGAAVRAAHELAARLHADGLHAHEAIVLYDVVRLGRAQDVLAQITALVGKADGLTEIMAGHARAAANRDAVALLEVADRFAQLGLRLFAAEAAAQAFNRLRQTRSGRVVEAARILADLLDSCEGAHTPGLLVARASLSHRERQIAQLAAAGVTSRDIADQLFLSVRTVDNHLRRVYAKLGVSGRGELGAALRALADGR